MAVRIGSSSSSSVLAVVGGERPAAERPGVGEDALLDGELACEAVEVRREEAVGPAFADPLDRVHQPVALVDRAPAGVP